CTNSEVDDGVGPGIVKEGDGILEIRISEGVVNDAYRMRQAKRRIVQKYQPDIDGHTSVIAELFQHVTLAQKAVGKRLNGAVARRVGTEISGAILGEVDLARLAVRPQELAGVIAAGDGDGVEP